MKANRRKVLGLFAVSPLAAKKAADDLIAKQVGVGKNFLAPAEYALGGGPPVGGLSAGSIEQVYIPHEEKIIRTADWAKLFGIPDVVELELRRQAKWVGGLDPDIATKRSWSMSVKIQEQRQRNYERLVESIQTAGWIERKKKTLSELLGFRWPF